MDRLEQLRGIARHSAWLVWGKVRGGDHGLDFDDLESTAMEAILRALPRHDGRASDQLLWQRAKGAALDAVREADPIGRHERRRRSEAGESTHVLSEWAAEWESLRFDRAEAVAAERALLETRDAARIVRIALAQLGEADRSLLVRLYFDDALQSEVAKERGMSLARLSQLHGLALLRLQARLIQLRACDAA